MNLHSIHTAWLIPGEKTPCDIYFYFRGSYVVALKEGAEISLDFVSKLFKTEYPLAYISKSKLESWQSWIAKRHPHLLADAAPAANTKSENKSSSKYGNKRAELLGYLQKSIVLRQPNNQELKEADQFVAGLLKKAVQGPVWDWYFHQFHEPPDLFHHGARVSWLAVMLAYRSGIKDSALLERAAQAALVHELAGDPQSSLSKVVSEQTILSLEKEGYPIAKEVVDLIRMHDEMYSGAGFPKKLKGDQIPLVAHAFTLCNHFDHLRLMAQGASRRVRFEASKKALDLKKNNYEPTLYPLFWQMVSEEFEVVG